MQHSGATAPIPHPYPKIRNAYGVSHHGAIDRYRGIAIDLQTGAREPPN